MSIDKLRRMFKSLETCIAWQIQFLKINKSSTKDISYVGVEVTLSPYTAISSFISEISKKYIEKLNSYDEVIEYDGSSIGNVIYKFDTSNSLISEQYDKFLQAVAESDSETSPLDIKANAAVIYGSITIDDEKKPVKLISMSTPFTKMKHKFLHSEGTFKEINDKVITLRKSIDVIIFDGIIYMININGEKLFNIERIYKNICRKKLDRIYECNIVSDFELFRKVASSGNNPRKFLSFNDEYLKKMENADIREKIAKKFNISMKEGLFDVSKEDTTHKLIKILCNKGMVDPFYGDPMEVAGSRKWK